MINQVTSLRPLSQKTFERFRKLIYQKTNIHMRDSKHILVSNRLRKRLVALGLGSYEEYYRYLTEDDRREEEMPNFIAAVSTNETYFFRETSHFDALRESILPDLFRRKKRLRIWSAGCSSGEEPYTLRIVLDQGAGVLWDGEAEIIATDISCEMIRQAREGLYLDRAIRFVPPAVLHSCFVPEGSGFWRLKENLRRGVEFRVHNMLSDTPPERSFDIVFCRNVMIYFDKETQRRLVDERFGAVLPPGGYLCIGHSESLTGISVRFRYQRGFKAPIYLRIGEQP